MKQEILSAYDSKAAVFCTPFFAPLVAIALRAFAGAVNKPGSTIYDHPEDFTLYHMGEFEDSTGEFTMKKQPVPLAVAASLKKHVMLIPTTETVNGAQVGAQEE